MEPGQGRAREDRKLTAVDGVDGRKGNEEREVGMTAVYTVKTQTHGRRDRHGVLAAVGKMREAIPSIVVTTQALERSPYRRERGEETHQSRMV